MSQFCPQCGTKNLDEAKFCKNCGFDMQQAVSQIEKSKSNSAQSPKSTSTDTTKKTEDEIKREKLAQELRSKIDTRNKYSETDGNPTNPWNGFLLLIGIFIGLFLTIKACSSSPQDIMAGSPYEDSYNQIPASSTEEKKETNSELKTISPEIENKDDFYFEQSVQLRDNKNGGYKNPERALSLLTNAIQINPNESVYYNDRANAYLQLEKHQKAIQDFNKAIKLDSKDPLIYRNRGYTYWDMGDITKAKADAKKACSLGQCELKKDIAKWEKDNASSMEAVAPAAEETTIEGETSY